MDLSIIRWEGPISFRIAKRFRVRGAKFEVSEMTKICSPKGEPGSVQLLSSCVWQ